MAQRTTGIQPHLAAAAVLLVACSKPGGSSPPHSATAVDAGPSSPPSAAPIAAPPPGDTPLAAPSSSAPPRHLCSGPPPSRHGTQWDDLNAELLKAARVRDLGEISAARSILERTMGAARAVGDKCKEGSLFHAYGQILVLQDEPARARSFLEQAITLFRGLGEPLWAVEVELSLADATTAEGLMGATALMKQVRAELRTARDEGHPEVRLEIEAGLVAAEALAMMGDANVEGTVEAARARDLAEKAGESAVGRDLSLRAAIVGAHVMASTGDQQKRPEAQKRLLAALAEAKEKGFVRWALEARLGLGKLAMASGRADAGRADLRALSDEAQRWGFLLIARRAKKAAEKP